MITLANRFRLLVIAIIVLLVSIFTFVSIDSDWFSACMYSNISSSGVYDQHKAISFSDTVRFDFKLSSINCSMLDFAVSDYPCLVEHYDDFTFSVQDNSGKFKLISTDNSTKDSFFYDTEYFHIKLPNDIDTSGNISFTIVNNTDNALTLPFYTTASTDTSVSFLHDHIKENMTIVSRYASKSTNITKLIILCVFVLALAVFVLFAKDLNTKSYILLCLCFGLIFIVIQTFPASQIEANSVIEMNRLSSGKFDLSAKGDYWLPGNLTSELSYAHNTDVILSKDFSLYSTEPASGFNFTNILLVAVSWISGLFGLSYFWQVAIARLLCYLFVCIICSIAIAISGKHKPVIFFLSSIPGIMLSFTNISSISILYALVIFFVSCSCNAFDCSANDKKASLTTPRLLVMILALILVGSYNLYVMFILFMFVFFIPSNSFVANKKSLFMWLFALFAVLTVAFRVYYIVINASVLEPTFNAVVNSLNNIGSRPVSLIDSFIPFIFTSTLKEASSLVGTSVSPIISSCLIFAASSIFFFGKQIIQINRDGMDANEALDSINACRSTRHITVIICLLSLVYAFVCYLSFDLFKGGVWAILATLLALVNVRHSYDCESHKTPILYFTTLSIVLCFAQLLLK